MNFVPKAIRKTAHFLSSRHKSEIAARKDKEVDVEIGANQ